MLRKLTLAVLALSLAAVAATPAANPGPAPAASKDKANTNPVAIFHTTAGDLKCELFPSKAPKTVENFVGLASGTKEWTSPASGQKQTRPLYDGTIFHRVIPEFMIQGGDPLGQGVGGPGYKFQDEFDSSLGFDRPGRLAMANSGPNTNGSQFFITEVRTEFLNGKHTIFGQCDDKSIELVKKIARMPTGLNNRPTDPVKINHIEIIAPAAAPAKPAAAPKAQ